MLGMSKKHCSEPNMVLHGSVKTLNPELEVNQSSDRVSSERGSRPELKKVVPKMDLESPRQKLRIIKMLARKPENR